MEQESLRQRIADEYGMTMAEVEAMGEIEWRPSESERLGYIDPRKDDDEFRPVFDNWTTAVAAVEEDLIMVCEPQTGEKA